MCTEVGDHAAGAVPGVSQVLRGCKGSSPPEGPSLVIPHPLVGLRHLDFFFKGRIWTFQARHRIRAAAASLHHSHSNAGSEQCLRATPQLTAAPDP